MATPKKTAPAQSEQTEPVAQVTYCDSRYTSRPLFLATGRQLDVARGRVSVPKDDTEAQQYLDAHADFKPLQE